MAELKQDIESLAPPTVREYWSFCEWLESIQSNERWGKIPRTAAEIRCYELYTQILNAYEIGDPEIVAFVEATQVPDEGAKHTIANALNAPWLNKSGSSGKTQKGRVAAQFKFLQALGGLPALLLFDKNMSLKTM